MEAKFTTSEIPKPNVRLIVFAALTMLVLIAGVTRSMHLAEADEAASEQVAEQAVESTDTGVPGNDG